MTAPDTRIRIQVEDLRGNSQAVTVDTANVDDDLKAWLDEWIADTAEQLDLHPEKVSLLLVAELVQRHHDAIAYRREAARRGVLAL